MRNLRADCGDLAHHGLLVRGFYRCLVTSQAERGDHSVRSRQRDLEAHMCRQLPRALGSLEVCIGCVRFARITELAKAELVGRDAVRQRHEWQVDRGGSRGWGHRSQEWVGAQQGKLPRNPHASASRLAIGYPLQPIAEDPAESCKCLGDGIETDRADEMDGAGRCWCVSHCVSPDHARMAWLKRSLRFATVSSSD